MASGFKGRANRHLPLHALAYAMLLALGGCQSGSGSAKDVPVLVQPDDQLIANTMAGAAERAGDLGSAQQYYGRIIAAGKGTLNTYERRGSILLSLGVPEEAAAVFGQALQAGFDSLDIRRDYGRALAWLGQGEAALAQYDAALAKRPGDVRVMNGRGVALDMLGRHDEAQAQYRGAMAAAPADLAVQNNLAMSLALSGKVDQAVMILERINASGVSSVQHRQNLALLYGLLGRMDMAAELARRDLPADVAAKNLAAYATLQHLYEGGRPAEVVAAPKAAVTSMPLPPAAAQLAPLPVAPPPVSTPAPASPVPAVPTLAAATPEVQASVEAVQVPAPVPAAPAVSLRTDAAPASAAEPVRQPWVLDLGLLESDAGARDAWAGLKQAGGDRFAQVVHYLEAEGTSRRLLAGPFWGEVAARDACDFVRAQGMQCTPRQASAVRTGSAAPAPGAPAPQ